MDVTSSAAVSGVRRSATHTDSDALGGSSKGFKPIGAGAGSAAGSASASAASASSAVVTSSQSLLSLPDAAALERAAGAGRSPTSSDSEGISTKGGEDGDDVVARMAAACRTILECLGEDPAREGLVKTPARMAKALLACTAGYAQDPRDIVSDALFECSSEEMVLVRDIECYSMCEHHMLPFFGRVHIGYLPSGRVVGLSKLARLTDCFSKRLQIQERLTQQIAEAVQDCVGAKGVAVVVECTHMCMTMRGVEKPGALTVSSAFTGAFKDDRALRTEFFAAVRGGAGR